MWEDASVGQFVGHVSLSQGSDGENAHFKMLSSNEPFAIDSNTGVVTTAKALDHEQTAFYKLRIRVTQQELRTDVTCYVFVEDRNDNAPRFVEKMPTVVVNEDTPVGSEVYRLKFSDDDSGNVGYCLSVLC